VEERSILEHYASGSERDRLAGGTSRIKFARTKELLQRVLPGPPANVLDVGGGPGAYASWLAGLGYRVHLVDPVPLHVEQATETARGSTEPYTAAVGDARRLDHEDGSFDAVLMLGPLYHLTERSDRVGALAEARRVVRPRGMVAGAAISRFASLFDGLASGFLGDPAFDGIVERDLLDGQHRNPTDRTEWFTTAYFHTPDGLASEVERAGFTGTALYGVEGPGWPLRQDWADPRRREQILFAARTVETQPSVLGFSLHVIAAATRP